MSLDSDSPQSKRCSEELFRVTHWMGVVSGPWDWDSLWTDLGRAGQGLLSK